MEHEIRHRIVAPPIEDLLAVPHLVLASGGRQKTSILRAALRRGLAHSLVIDEQASRDLLAG